MPHRIFNTHTMEAAFCRPVILWKRIDRGFLVEDRSRRIFNTHMMEAAFCRPVVLWKRINKGFLVEDEEQVP